MDLSGGTVLQGKTRYPILTGWINTIDEMRNEARGYFVIESARPLSLLEGPIILIADGLCFSVVLLQVRPSGLAEQCRERFIALCAPSLCRPQLRLDPDLTATQELFIGTDLTTLVLDEILSSPTAPGTFASVSEANALGK